MSFDYVVTEAKRIRLQDAAREVHERFEAAEAARKAFTDATDAHLAAEHSLAIAKRAFEAAAAQILPEPMR